MTESQHFKPNTYLLVQYPGSQSGVWRPLTEQLTLRNIGSSLFHGSLLIESEFVKV